jgi:acetyl-CoA C-acetyltransferase
VRSTIPRRWRATLRAGLPLTVPGMMIDPRCASGLMAIAAAAKQILLDGMDVDVGDDGDSVSLPEEWESSAYSKSSSLASEYERALTEE